MSLANVVTGKQIGPQIHTAFGVNGVGKTTWAAAFPQCLMADLEKGSGHLDVARDSSIEKLEQFRALVRELKESNHNYLSFAVDSVEALEGLINDAVCIEGNVNSIEKYEGGFGKGYTRTREIMREIMMDLQGLKTKGITSILVAHSQVKQISDPATNQAYDRVIMRANDKLAAVVRDLSDNVFYASYKVFTTKDNGKTKAFGDGQRVMYTQWRPGFDAKNRLDLPFELPLSYDAFIEACAAKPEADVQTIIGEIEEMSKTLDESMKVKVREQLVRFKSNPVKLQEVKNRLMKYAAA